jgi:hypothetical protein
MAPRGRRLNNPHAVEMCVYIVRAFMGICALLTFVPPAHAQGTVGTTVKAVSAEGGTYI